MNFTRIRRAVRATLLTSLAALTMTGLLACTDTSSAPSVEVAATGAQPAPAPTATPTPQLAAPGAAAPTLDVLAARLPADTTLIVATDVDALLTALTPGGNDGTRAALRKDYATSFNEALGVDAAGATWMGLVGGKSDWFALVVGGEVTMTPSATREVAGLQVHTLKEKDAAAFTQDGWTVFADSDDIDAIATAFAATEKLAAAPAFASLKKAADAAGAAPMLGVMALDAEWLDKANVDLPAEIAALDAVGMSGGQVLKLVATGTPEAVTNAKTAWDKMLTDGLAEVEADYAARTTAPFDDALTATLAHHVVAALKKGYSPTFSGELVSLEINAGELLAGRGAMALLPALAATMMVPRKMAESAAMPVEVMPPDTAVEAPTPVEAPAPDAPAEPEKAPVEPTTP